MRSQMERRYDTLASLAASFGEAAPARPVELAEVRDDDEGEAELAALAQARGELLLARIDDQRIRAMAAEVAGLLRDDAAGRPVPLSVAMARLGGYLGICGSGAHGLTLLDAWSALAQGDLRARMRYADQRRWIVSACGDGPQPVKALVEASGLQHHSLRRLCREMCADGELVLRADGQYELPEAGPGAGGEGTV